MKPRPNLGIQLLQERDSVKELHRKPLGIQADDFTTAFDFAPIVRKGARHHHVLTHEKLHLALDVSPSGAEVYNAALEKPAVGSEMGVFRALGTGVSAVLRILGTAQTSFYGFGCRMHPTGRGMLGYFPGHRISHGQRSCGVPGDTPANGHCHGVHDGGNLVAEEKKLKVQEDRDHRDRMAAAF